MKTTEKAVAAILLTVLLLLPSFEATGQVPEFVPGDDNYRLLLAFHNTDTLLVVTPDGFELSGADREMIEAFPFWGGFQRIPYYRYLSESDLKPADLAGRIHYYGPFHMFRNACYDGMPFRKSRDGFIIADPGYMSAAGQPAVAPGYGIYNDPSDSFFWLSDDTLRLFTCSNKGHGFSQYRTYMAGYYQLYIFRGDDLHITGYASLPPAARGSGFKDSLPVTHSAGTIRVNYLPQLRREYFRSFHGKYFDFEIASSLNTDSTGIMIAREADQFAGTLFGILGFTASPDEPSRCDTLHDRPDLLSSGYAKSRPSILLTSNAPTGDGARPEAAGIQSQQRHGIEIDRILTYIYADRSHLERFIAAPSWTTVFGKASGNVNHLSLFDPVLFRHESAHSIIEQVAGSNPYCFFSEGFAVSMEYIFTPGSLAKDRAAIADSVCLLTRELLYSTSGQFYSNPIFYQLSGVFTKYLTEILGISEFIRAYSDNTIEACLKNKTGLDMEQIINQFRESLQD